jgi:vitamin B12 transporter
VVLCHRTIVRLSIICILLIGAPTTALAQQPVVVTGTITDASGAVLPGATVDALAGNRITATATTGTDGHYRIELTSTRTARVRVGLDGFTTQTTTLMATANVSRDFQLGIAPLNDTIVVTASRTVERRAAVTESLAIFTAEDIQTIGRQSLADVVRFVPGLNVEATGREGATASLFSRGGESDYNQVLIDGVRVNTNGGQFDFSRVSISEIERIEVVRGAQSALYGSDAINSVIQIFTKRGTPSGAPQLSGSIEGGSFGTTRSDLRVLGGAQQRIDYQFGATYRGSDGAFSDRLTQLDEFDQTTIDGNVGALLGDLVRLRTGFRYSDARGRSVGQIAYGPGDIGTGVDSEDVSWNLNFDQQLTARVNHSAAVTYFRSDSLVDDTVSDAPYNVYAILEGVPGAHFPDSERLVRLLDESSFDALVDDSSGLGARQFLANTPFGIFDFPFTFASNFRRPAAKYQVNAAWMDNQVLSAGYDYYRETDPLNSGFLVSNNGYFAQQQFTVANRWFVTVGGRVDDNSRYGIEVSPKLSVGGYPIPFSEGPVSSIKVFANVGKGIKNPTFGELFGSGFSDGNPNLKPERARTVDVGTEVTFDDQRWIGRVTYFDNEYKDQVAFQSTGFDVDGLPDFLNITGSQGNGVEFETALQRPIAGVTFSATYALVNTEVVATISTDEQFQPGQPLLRRPKHSGTARVTYTRGRGDVYLNLRAVGERHDAAFFSSASFASFTRVSDGRAVDIRFNPGYTTLDLGGQFRAHDALTIFLRIDNLTNETYESALGFPGLPRAFVSGGRFTLGG